jgi:hypothetical protein
LSCGLVIDSWENLGGSWVWGKSTKLCKQECCKKKNSRGVSRGVKGRAYTCQKGPVATTWRLTFTTTKVFSSLDCGPSRGGQHTAKSQSDSTYTAQYCGNGMNTTQIVFETPLDGACCVKRRFVSGHVRAHRRAAACARRPRALRTTPPRTVQSK